MHINSIVYNLCFYRSISIEYYSANICFRLKDIFGYGCKYEIIKHWLETAWCNGFFKDEKT